MSTRGFEFAGMLDGSSAVPVEYDLVLGVAVAHKKGDLMIVQADGYVDKVTATFSEVTCIIAEAIAAADVTAGTTKVKCSIITRNQIWRCSMDASTTALLVGYTKTGDVVDENTIDADGSAGTMCYLDVSETDSDSNVVAKVVFQDTTFGTAA